MPLTECPDCRGVVSDAALTCPTCHRVLGTIDTGGGFLVQRLGRWALGGLLALVGLWVLMKVLA